MSECPHADVMHKQIAAHRQRVAGFLGFEAEYVRVEQAQIGPLIESFVDLPSTSRMTLNDQLATKCVARMKCHKIQ